MKYLIIGAGGTGGMIAAALAKNGYDADILARGSHLAAIKKNGLHIKSDLFGNFSLHIPAFSQDDYCSNPDVIFICLKYYSLNEIIPFIKKISNKKTIIIPILNVFGTGLKIQNQIPQSIVIDGCIYIISYKNADGEISHPSNMFKIVFGQRQGQIVDNNILKQIADDLNNSGIKAVLSDKIESDTFAKITLISPYAACGAYYDVPVGNMQKNGDARNLLSGLLGELQVIADNLNLDLGFDVVERNLSIIDKMSPDTISSLYRDIKNNHQSEVDGQIFDIVRLGRKLNVPVPFYEKVARKLGFTE